MASILYVWLCSWNHLTPVHVFKLKTANGLCFRSHLYLHAELNDDLDKNECFLKSNRDTLFLATYFSSLTIAVDLSLSEAPLDTDPDIQLNHGPLCPYWGVLQGPGALVSLASVVLLLIFLDPFPLIQFYKILGLTPSLPHIQASPDTSVQNLNYPLFCLFCLSILLQSLPFSDDPFSGAFGLRHVPH